MFMRPTALSGNYIYALTLICHLLQAGRLARQRPCQCPLLQFTAKLGQELKPQIGTGPLEAVCGLAQRIGIAAGKGIIHVLQTGSRVLNIRFQQRRKLFIQNIAQLLQ
jgi:hypothetical protein